MTNYEAQQKIIENNEIIALYAGMDLNADEECMIAHLESENVNCVKSLRSSAIFAI